MPEKKEVEIDGQKMTVYDAASVEKVLQDKETTFTTEKTTLETNLKTATEALEKSKEGEKDFAALRTAKEAAEKELREKTEAHTKEVTELKSAPLTEHRTNLTKLLSGGDKDVTAKMDHFLKESLSAMPETTKEQIDAKLKTAYQLAVGGNYKEDYVSRVISSAGGGDGGGTADVKTELKSIGKNFGLNDKDWDNARGAGVI